MSSTSFNFTNNITNAPTTFASPSNVGTLGSRSIQIAPGPLLPRAFGLPGRRGSEGRAGKVKAQGRTQAGYPGRDDLQDHKAVGGLRQKGFHLHRSIPKRLRRIVKG